MKRKLRTYCCGPKCDATRFAEAGNAYKKKYGAQTLESVRPVEHSSRIAENTGLSKRRSQQTAQARNWAQKHHVKEAQHTPSPITTYYIFSLFAVVRAAEYAPIAWHRAKGAFIPHGATAERCIMVVCPLGRSRYRGSWDKKRVKETRNQTWSKPRHPQGALNPRMSGGAEKRGSKRGTAKMFYEVPQEQGVTSVLRLHDATNANLSTEHEVAKQAANEIVLKEIDKYYFDQRISSAVVTIGGEEGNNDMLATRTSR